MRDPSLLAEWLQVGLGIASLIGSLALWIGSHVHGKRSAAAAALRQDDLAARARIEHRIGRKVDAYLEMITHPGAWPLQTLGELKLGELGSNEHIRRVLDEIEMRTRADPWEGHADVADEVDLVRFFTYVTEQKISITPANLRTMVVEVRNAGGAPYPVQRFQKKPPSFRKLAPKALLVVGMLLLLGPTYRWISRKSADPGAVLPRPAAPVVPVDSTVNEVMDTASEVRDTGSSAGTNRVPGRVGTRTSSQRGDSIDAYIAEQVAQARQAILEARRSTTPGAYSHAIRTLKGALTQMTALQSRFPRNSQLRNVIDELRREIAETESSCRTDSSVAGRLGNPIPQCS